MNLSVGPTPREKRKKQATKWLVFAILGTVVFVGLAVAFYNKAREVNPVLNSNLCPKDASTQAEVIIVFDATDPWNEVQKEVIKQEFRSLQSGVERFARLSFYRVGTGKPDSLPKPALQLCNPGTIGQLGEVQAKFFANPDSIRKRWERGFIDQVNQIVPEAAEERSSSHIMETIRGAALQTFGSTGRRTSVEKRVYIFSDLLQNSPLYSHYTDKMWEPAEARSLADVSRAGTLALNGVTIEIFLIDRPFVGTRDGHSRSRLVAFWDAYFGAQGAKVMSIRRVEG